MRWGVIVLLSLPAVLISVTLLAHFYHSFPGSVSSKTERDELEELLYDDYGPQALSENETFDTNITTDAPTEVPFLVIDIDATPLPFCNDDELIAFDGVDLFCTLIPERDCRCPGPVETTEVTPQPFLPPRGCTVFEPPEGGAFVCLSVEGVQIYCSVLCDDKSEFSSFPLNPYTCGAITSFKWVDSTNRTRNILPECSSIRQSVRPLHFSENYLPNVCNELSEQDANQIKEDFCINLLQYFTFSLIGCSIEDVTIQCGN